MGEAVAWPRRWGQDSQASLFSLPAHRTLLRSQRGVLVHSRWAAGVIAEQLPEVRVQAVPMGVPLPPPANPAQGRELRRSLGIPEGHPILGSFGFQTPIKRTDKAIATLAQPGLETVHLLIVGEVSPACDLLAAARKAGVAERVHVMGFVDYDQFESAIAATDLCLNLRYPTAGETSASLLRVLAMGRPAVVSDFAQFAELPDRGVVKVPLGEDEVAALAAELRQLLAAPHRLREMGAAARQHVAQEHNPARAAAAVVAACQPWTGLEPPDRAPQGSTGPQDGAPEDQLVPTTLTWETLPGELRVTGAEAPWASGERRRLEVHLDNQSHARWLPGEAGAGGVALQLQLLVTDASGTPRDLLAGRPWLPLPRPLDPGEHCRLEVDVRRPPGPAQLRIEPHVLGGFGFGALGGPVWQQELK